MNNIYIDSHFKTKDSQSNTDFKIYLNQSLEIKEDMKMYITDISIPDTWYSIESTNENLYVLITENGISRHLLIKLDNKNYSVVELAAHIQAKLRAALNKTFTLTYASNTGRLSFNVTQTNFTYSILTDSQLKSFVGWTGQYYNPNNIKSCNDILNNDISQVCSSTSIYVSGFVNTMNYANLYLHSNISSFENIGPDGNSTNIIKKIPTTAPYGSLMTNYDFNPLDYTLIKNRNAISMLEFKFTDSYNNVINLHGSHVSFTLLFIDD